MTTPQDERAPADDAGEPARLACEVAGAALLTLDAQLRIVDASGPAVALLADAPGGLHRVPLASLFGEAGRADFEGVARALAPDGPGRWRGDVVLPRPDGAHLRCAAGFVAHAGPPSRVTAVLAPAASAREERLALALAGSGLGLWDWNVASGDIVYDIPYERMLGFDPGEAPRGLAEWELSIHPDDRAEVLRLLREHLEGRAPHFESTHRLRTKDGGWSWILDRGAVASRDAQGRALRMVGTHRDVSAQRRLEEQLAQAQKMEAVGRLAGGLAHDFNNLLTSILSAAEFAGEGLPEGAPAREDLAVVREAAQRAAELTRQLLAFARKQVVAPRVVALPALLGETARLLRRTVGEDVEIAIDAAHDTWPVRVDPALLQQVVVNLATTARAAMPRGGRLALALRNVRLAAPARGVGAGEWVELTVSDSASGLSGEEPAGAFEPLSAASAPGCGAGALALAMVSGAVKQAGGHATVASEQGGGTRFEILLPRAASATAADHAAGACAASCRGGETILLVEDDALVLEMNARALAALGYEVLACRTGEEAVSRARSHRGRIDLLVTDVVMPRLAGPAVAREVAALQPALRVLFVSGYAEELAARGVSGAAFLAKPFTPRALAARIREVLDGRAPPPAAVPRAAQNLASAK